MKGIRNWLAGVLSLPFMALSGSVGASEGFDYAGLWYQPDRPGTGILITPDMGAGHGVIWYLHRRDGTSAFIVGGENCTSFPCVVTLKEPTANWLGGNLDLGEPVGNVDFSEWDGRLRVNFDLRELSPEICEGISIGGILLRECAGTKFFSRLAD